MDKSVGRLVSILYRKNQVYLNIVFKQLNITASELPIITYLLGHEGVTQEELSSYLVIDKASTARVVQSLLDKGFLRKEKDAVDRRANRVSATEECKELQPQIRELLMQWSAFLTEGLDAQAVDTMYAVLDTMVKKVESVDFREMWRDAEWNR